MSSSTNPDIAHGVDFTSENLVDIAQHALTVLYGTMTSPQSTGTMHTNTSSHSGAHFTNLPSEALVEIARRLPIRDLLSLMRTCKVIHGSIKGVPVEQIKWSIGGCFSALLPTDLVEVKNGQLLADILVPRPAGYKGLPKPGPLAKCVIKLYMGGFCTARCIHTFYCGLTYVHLRHFQGLKDLTINVGFFKGNLDVLRLPERLVALRLYEGVFCRITRKKLCQSLGRIRHPKIRHLNLIEIRMESWTTQDLQLENLASSSLGPDPLNFPELETLALHSVDARMSVLGALVYKWRNARKLWFDTRLTSESRSSIDATEKFNFARLPTTLLPLKDTLVELYLTHSPEDDWIGTPNTFPGLIRHLRDFSNLKRLSIDPALFIGTHVCPLGAVPRTPFLGTAAFARVLPNQLEELALIINREQALRADLPTYRSDLIECILDLRRQQIGLMHLQTVVFVEDAYYAPKKRCVTKWEERSIDIPIVDGHRHCYTDFDLFEVVFSPGEIKKLLAQSEECDALGILLDVWWRQTFEPRLPNERGKYFPREGRGYSEWMCPPGF